MNLSIFVVQLRVEATPPPTIKHNDPSIIAGFSLMTDASLFRNAIDRKYRRRSMRPVKVRFYIYADRANDGLLHYRKLA